LSLYCIPCSTSQGRLSLLPSGQSYCGRCGSYVLACSTCRRSVAAGSSTCSHCSEVALVATRDLRPPPLPNLPACLPVVSVEIRGGGSRGIMPSLPAVNVIPDVYGGGSHGVEAEIFLPPGDAAILNELLAMVGMLHATASRLTQLAGMSDHTRQVVRDMRSLANLAQEELEMRAGTRGG
jgi:hypothetical protein